MLVAGGVTAAGGAWWALASTRWGHDRLRVFVERQVAALLAPGARFTIGALEGSATGAWTADSVVARDADGHPVIEVGQVRVTARFAALLRGEVRIGVVTIDRPRIRLVRDAHGEWNVGRLVAAARPGAHPELATRRLVTVDSIAVRDGVVDVVLPGTAPSLPLVRRRVFAVNAAFGPTTISSPVAPGGSTDLRALSFALDRPAIARVAAQAYVRWWDDSLRFDVPSVRLPASHASASGVVAWRPNRPARLSLNILADTVAFADLRELSPRVPASGVARATVAIRSEPDGNLRIEARHFAVTSGRSRASGSATFVTGTPAQLRDVRVAASALDLNLVRQVAGDSAPGRAWQGDVSLTVGARGGALDSLVVDSVAVAFHDARTGAVSSVRAAGDLDVASRTPRIIGATVRVDSLAVRTLGAVTPAADSIAGIIEGRAHIAGDATGIVFDGLRLRHVDRALPASVVSGSGAVRPDRRGRWLSLDLTLDSVALATLARGRTSLPVSGTPHGRLAVTGTGDTLALETTVRDGEAVVHAGGHVLLGDTTARIALRGTMHDVDPRRFIARADIPAMRLSGAVTVEAGDDDGGERHVAVRLDSTSRIGESAIRSGHIRAGFDRRGFHIDTAAVVADGWMAHARGRLAGDSSATDSLAFTFAADSLAVLRAVVLDTAGAPLLPDLGGRVVVSNGSLAGSVAAFTLRADVEVARFAGGGVAVDSGAAAIAIRALPRHGTGAIRGTLFGLALGAARFDTARIRAQVSDGTQARVAWDATEVSRAVAVAGGVTVTRPDGSYRVVVDSLRASVGNRHWQLAVPSLVVARGGVVEVDTTQFRSDQGASVVASASWPERGAVRADVAVERLGVQELAFLGILPVDLTGVVTARARVSGTRGAPIIDATATLDSIYSEDRERPSLAFTGHYADRTAALRLTATSAGRRVLTATGDIPLDLSFRDVADRIVNAPMSLRFVADSASLLPFEGLAPGVRNLVGTVNGAVDVAGTLRRPLGTGTLTLTDGGFEMPRAGFAVRRADAELTLAGDSVLVRRVRVSDTDSPRDTAAAWGVVRLAGNRWSEWEVDLQSVANKFRVIDDPRLATAEADWNLKVKGRLRSPGVSGTVTLPYAMFTIGPQRRPRRPLTDSTGAPPAGTPYADGVVVALGSDVRLRSRDANVQLAGSVELFGPLNRPWISGTVQATRGTYRVDLGVLKRTFRVDSGAVVLEGTTDVPPALDISASYVVRQPESDDVTIRAHLYGTTDRPRLDLSSDLGTAVGPSEIISYLVFGKPSFAVPENRKATVQTAYQALVPSFLGGWIEGALGTVLPFFNTLQVTTVGRDDPRLSANNPIEGLLSSFAVTGGRQVGTDTFLSVTTGVCTGTTVATTNNSPIWFGTAAEYRPKRSLGAAISIDPGPAPCSRVTSLGDAYQIGFDLLYDWRFGRRR